MGVNGISIDRVTITALPADRDATTERLLTERFKAYVAEGRLVHAVSLDDDTFDSQSLSLLLRLSCIVNDASGTMSLVTERPQTRSVLDATRMNKLFTVFATVDAAVASLAPVARKLSA
jgi:anti-anti-sigma factor